MKVRVGFVGGGGIADVHLKNISENEQAELIAVCDISREIAEKKAGQYGIKAYTDFNEMLESEKLDVLFVCVPPFAHGDIEERAAAKGIHLFVEKPLGLDMSVVRRKAQVLKEAGIMIGTGYCLRYLDTVAKAKEYLQNKEIAFVRAHYFTSFVATPWWRNKEKSGGQLVEQTTHTVDLVRYLCGDMKKVYADMDLRIMKDVEGISIPDVGSVSVVFESGAIGHIDTTFVQFDHRTGVEILGKDFRLVIDGVNLSIVERERTITYNSKINFYKEQDLMFIEAIRTQNPSLILSTYEDAMKTLEVTLAANESAETGRSVTLT